MNKNNSLKGGLYGLLIGDALGVPYEFHSPSAIPPRALIDMTPSAHFRRAHASVKPDTWSDDGALGLCLLDSLIENDGLDLANLAAKFLVWGSGGYMAVDGHVFDMGNQTSRAQYSHISRTDRLSHHWSVQRITLRIVGDLARHVQIPWLVVVHKIRNSFVRGARKLFRRRSFCLAPEIRW